MKKIFLMLVLIIPCVLGVTSCKNTEDMFICDNINYGVNGLMTNKDYMPKDNKNNIIVYDSYKKNLGYEPENAEKGWDIAYISFKNDGYIKKIQFSGDKVETDKKFISEKAFEGCDSIETILFNNFSYWGGNETIKHAGTGPYCVATPMALNQLRNLKEFKIVDPFDVISDYGLEVQSVRDDFLCLDLYSKQVNSEGLDTYVLGTTYYIAYPMGLGNRMTITSTNHVRLSLEMFRNCFYSKVYLTIPKNVEIGGYNNEIPSSVKIDKTEVFITVV